jgi:hypothetical protein
LLLLLLTKPQLLWLLMAKPRCLLLLLLLLLLLGLAQSLMLWQLRVALLPPCCNSLPVEGKDSIIGTVSRPGRGLC